MAETRKPQDRKAKKERKGATSASDWKKSSTHELDVPSGNTALVRRKGMETFIKKGTIPNTLMPIIQKAMGMENPEDLDIVAELGGIDDEKLTEVLGLYDAIVLDCVVEPKVLPVPTNEDGTPVPLSERDQDAIYIDEVDMEDKIFIFQWIVGGTSDVESFREEQDHNVSAVQASGRVEDPSV